MAVTPAVPGAINISSLTGEEIVQLQSGGQSTAQTTTQDIANLAGGGGGGTGPTGPTGPTGSGTTGATGPTGGGGSLLTATVSISSAELLAIHDTPQVIVAAPGAGKFIQVLAATYGYHAGSTGYSGSDGPGLSYTPGNLGTNNIDTSGLGAVIASTTSSVVPVNVGSAASGNAGISAINSPLYFGDDENWTLGNGTLTVSVSYVVITP